ncbi:MAG: Sec-independent protein translocase protein TatB [Acidiferrobacterales bacterium]|jgi:sec-independent protein translocase protein TatB|nr:Sec-independent protein translocase protein TatB [Acidiferrobacterales bacterium]
MFDIGFWELALIGVLALIVLGPKRLPEAARTAGKWVGKLRAFIANVQQDINQEMDRGELEELRRLKDELNQTRLSIEESTQSVYQGINSLAGSEDANSIGLPTQKESTAKKTKKKAKKKKASKKSAAVRTTKKKTAKKKTAKRGSRKS